MKFAPTQFHEAHAVAPKTEAGLRMGGGSRNFGGDVRDVPKAGNTAPFTTPAIVERLTALTVPAPLGVGQHES